MLYFNIILTDHALKRMKERRLTKEQAWEVLNHPEGEYNTEKGSHAFFKNYDDYKATVIAKKNEKNEWIIVSFWRDPPLPGTKDAADKKDWRKFKKAGFWGKIFLTTKKQLGF